MFGLFRRKDKKAEIPAPQAAPIDLRAPITDLAAAIAQKRIESLVGPEAHNTGDFTLGTGIKLDGRHTGSITIKSDRGIAFVSETGVVDGDVTAPQVYVHGTVTGTITADLIVLEKKARVSGRLITNRLMFRSISDMSIEADVVSHRCAAEKSAEVGGNIVRIAG